MTGQPVHSCPPRHAPLGRMLGMALLLTAPAIAQVPRFNKVEVRVIATPRAGVVTIDRGARDLVQKGDKVVLLPRDGRVLHGTVSATESRTSTVELVNPNDQVRPGVRGEVLVPRMRRKQQNEPAKPPGQAGDPAAGDPATEPTDPGKPAGDPADRSGAKPEDGKRRFGDDNWRPGMPLLTGGRPLRPNERVTRTTGQVYTAGDLTRTLDTWNNSYFRLGTNLDVENPAGFGGVLRINTEFAQLTEINDQADPDLRVYELSYELGGNRYEPTRWTFGRYLSRDMPEFGLVDGIEWSHRTDSGQRFGISFGALPELDEDLDTGSDLQLSAYWLWPDTIADRLTFGLGYQKTWHHLRADRDLIVAKMRYLPIDGWDVAATTWVDIYYGSDTKGDGPELTRARAHATRRYETGGGLQFTYDHEELVDQRRSEFLQTIQPATLLNAHNDRVTMHAWSMTDGGSRLFTRITGFHDQSRTGGTAEAGFLADDWLMDEMRSGLAAFVVHGRHSTVAGGRLDHSGEAWGGRLDALLEVSFVHHESFNDDGDDLLQYRLGAYWTRAVGDNWYLLTYGDSTLWDTEFSMSAGFYLQRTF